MPRRTLEPRVAALEERADNTDRVIANMTQDIRELRESIERTDGHVTESRMEMRDGIADVKKTLGEVLSGALNSLPQWAAQQNQNMTIWVGILGGIAGVLAVFLVYLLAH